MYHVDIMIGRKDVGIVSMQWEPLNKGHIENIVFGISYIGYSRTSTMLTSLLY